MSQANNAGRVISEMVAQRRQITYSKQLNNFLLKIQLDMQFLIPVT